MAAEAFDERVGSTGVVCSYGVADPREITFGRRGINDPRHSLRSRSMVR
jgi:hypothetical protein